MSDLLVTLGWSPGREGALRFVGAIGLVTTCIVLATIGLGELAGTSAVWVQVAMWAGWLVWLGVLFPRSRMRMQASDCDRPYHLAFLRELLPGIGVNFALLLRPAAVGLLLGGPGEVGVPTIVGACLTLGGVALIASATSVIGVARAFFVHEYEDIGRGLVMRGVYERIRHPLFLGGMALSLGLALVVGASEGIAVAIVNVGVLPAYLLFEERRCSIVIGEPYERYCARTGAIVPRARRPLPGMRRWRR
jgi:protein-S-isoprenylcysteine O-methyltransferase Ste14